MKKCLTEGDDFPLLLEKLYTHKTVFVGVPLSTDSNLALSSHRYAASPEKKKNYEIYFLKQREPGVDRN